MDENTKAILGTDTTPYQPASLTGESVTGFKTLIDALNARSSQNTVTFSIEINGEKTDMDADTAAVTGNQLDDHDGIINTVIQLNDGQIVSGSSDKTHCIWRTLSSNTSTIRFAENI